MRTFFSFWGACIFLLCGGSVVVGQQQHIDSLDRELKYGEIVRFIDSLQTKDVKLLYQKAEALRKTGDVSEAILCLQRLCDSTKNMEYYYELADYYTTVGNEKRALQTLQRALGIAQSAKLYYKIGRLQYKLRLFEEGVRTCDEVLRRDTVPTVLRLQSSCYQKLNKTAEAKRLLMRGICRNPKDYLTVSALARLYKSEGDYEAILPLTENYLKRDSTNISVLSLNAYAYFSLFRYGEAKVRYENLFELGCAPADHYFYLGYIYYRLGHANDAYTYLYKANELAQGLNEVILYHLGLAALKSLRYEEAVSFLEKALHYYLPNEERIAEIYGRQSSAYRFLGQDTRAIKMLYKAMDYEYKHETLYRIAYLYETSGRKKQAIKAYQRFLKALPDSVKEQRLKSLRKMTEFHLKRLKEQQFMNRDATGLTQ